MSALLLENWRITLGKSAIVQIRVWQLEARTAERPHGLKYSLFYGRPGERIIVTTTKRAKAIIGIIEIGKSGIGSRRSRSSSPISGSMSERRWTMSEVRLHVEGLDAFVERAKAMARRLDRGERKAHAAHISFENMESLLRVLTPNRWTLLRTLRGLGPASIRALARALGRDYRGVHADVAALIDAGLIDRDDKALVFVPWSRITAEMALETAA